MIKKVTIDCKLNFGPPNMTNLATYLFYWANPPPLMPIPKKSVNFKQNSSIYYNSICLL